ncbi:MAG: Avidin family [Gammaproteobacteria bacterium]|jgi:hypothetical protein|nr:Avidin family [Gammaproteobacteria bacterium]MCE3237714.1 Avidin family [Gammaproteobacteria bacterium]
MKINNTVFITILSLLLSQMVFAASDSINYKNTRGSMLTLQFNLDNTLAGTFTTAVASKECPQAIGMKRPIIGFIAKNAITFSTNYPACGSVVTFIGNIEKNKTIIDTTAIVAHQSIEIATEGPGARMISHDVFTRT